MADTPEVLRFATHGVVVEMIGDALDPAALAIRFLDPGRATGEPALRYRLHDTSGIGRGPLVVSEGARVIGSAPTGEAAAALVVDHLHFELAQRATERLFVHSGAVVWRGRAVVVPGRSHTGKSTLVAALVAAGADYLSDEYAVVADDGAVSPYAKPMSVRGPHGVRTVDVEAIGGRVAPGPAPLAVVLATPYSTSAVGEYRLVRGTRATLPIVDNAVRARDETARVMRLAARLAAAVVAIVGPRPDAETAAPALLARVDELFDRADRLVTEQASGPG